MKRLAKVVKSMVYCKYNGNGNGIVTYMFGGETDDITGIVNFRVDGREFEVVKDPDKSEVSMRSLIRLYGKYKSDFSKGNFKDKLSYEC